MKSFPRAARLLVATILAAACAVTASRLAPPPEIPYDVALVPSSRSARWFSLGHPTLVANLFWLRTVQYIGEPRGNERGWERLYPLVDFVTDLDPGHGYAYQTAGVLLGTVGRIDESNAILEKGMERVPGRYILPFLRAFNAFYYAGDYALAGRFVERAARTPGAPAHLRDNVLAMYVKGGRADAAIAFLEEARRGARDPETAKELDAQILQARLERAAAPLDDAIAAYRARYGFAPAVLGQLVSEGLVGAIPPDPHGGLLVVGDDGRVHSTVNPKRFSPGEKPDEQLREPGIGAGRQKERR